MRYSPESPAGRLLLGEREALDEAIRWISTVLAGPGFWSIRREWPDLVQDVLSRVIESLRTGRFDPERELRTYVQGVARFTAFSAISRRTPEVQTDERSPEPAGSVEGRSAEDTLQAGQLARYVLDRASEDCRGLITAYFMEQKTYAEISSETDQPVGTLKSRLFRCLEAARVAVGGRGAARGE